MHYNLQFEGGNRHLLTAYIIVRDAKMEHILMTQEKDILVIGGGVIGVATAYYLAGEGRSVTLIDRPSPAKK